MENKALSPTSKLAKQLGSSSHKVQLMKASFFQPQDLNIGKFSFLITYMLYNNLYVLEKSK